MKSWILILASLFTLSALAGCNTVEGFGKDVQKGGEKIEETADKHN